MLYILLLLGSLLFGLALLAIGIILILKMKNKLPGIVVTAVGLFFTLAPLLVYLFLAPSSVIRS